jgi:hypothetical protein
VETVMWLLNGSTLETPLPSGVITETVHNVRGGPIGTLTFINPQLGYNSTTIRCRIHLDQHPPNILLSDVTTLFLQGNFWNVVAIACSCAFLARVWLIIMQIRKRVESQFNLTKVALSNSRPPITHCKNWCGSKELASTGVTHNIFLVTVNFYRLKSINNSMTTIILKLKISWKNHVAIASEAPAAKLPSTCFVFLKHSWSLISMALSTPLPPVS